MILFTFLRNSWLAVLLTVVVSYLLGSVNWAIIITRLFSNRDIRTVGSGNAGATNVLRSQGVFPAILTAVGDLTKGVLAVLIGGWMLNNINLFSADIETYSEENIRLMGQYIAGFFCVIGHLYPIFHEFRGGKGVLAAFGMFAVIDWRIAVMLVVLFAVTVLISRMVSLGSVLAASYLPMLTLVFRLWVDRMSTSAVVFCTVLSGIVAAIIVWRHGSNMRRISKGTEHRLGDEEGEKQP